MWFARSDVFLQQPFMETLRWMRIFGDTIFLAGVGAAWLALGVLA